MLGNEARGAAIEKRSAVDTRGWELYQSVRVRRQACACAARSADAAHRRGVCWVSAIAGIIVRAVAVIMHVLQGGGSATMMRLALRRQFACIAAQRRCREQQDE